MSLVGNKAPDWEATVYDNGEKKTLHSNELEGSWYLLFFWPFDFTGICGSEIVGFEELAPEFEKLGVKLLGASCDSFFSHKNWFESDDFGKAPTFPVLADNKNKISKKFGVYSKSVGCALRGTFLVNPEGVVMSSGVNYLPVARDPKDALVTAKAFVAGGGCSLPQRNEIT